MRSFGNLLGVCERVSVPANVWRILMSPAAIIALQGFFPLKGKAAVGIGAIEYPTAERKRLAVL